MALKDAKPEVGAPNKKAGWLLGGVGTITTLVVGLGVGADEISNVWRNHPYLSYPAVTMIVVALAMGAAAGWLLETGSKAERRTLIWGNVILGAGLILIAWAALGVASDRPEPSVTATVVRQGNQTVLKAVAENSKLRFDEDLSIAVDPLFEVNKPGEPIHYRVGRPLYSANRGPDKDGEARRTITLSLPPGNFKDVGVRASVDPETPCYDTHTTTSCVVVHVPPRVEQPQLTFDWRKASKAGASLRVHVTALDIPAGGLQFRARGLKPRRSLLAQVNLAPSLDGDIDHTFVLPVKGVRVLCVAASTTDPAQLKCPLLDRAGPASWSARLRVPRQR